MNYNPINLKKRTLLNYFQKEEKKNKYKLSSRSFNLSYSRNNPRNRVTSAEKIGMQSTRQRITLPYKRTRQIIIDSGDYKILILSIMVLERPTYHPSPLSPFSRVCVHAQCAQHANTTRFHTIWQREAPWLSGLAMAMPATGLTRI